MRLRLGCLCRLFRRRWRFMTAIAARGCRRICCRRSGISLERIPTSGLISRVASSSTPTGPDVAGRSLRQRITLRFESKRQRARGAQGSGSLPCGRCLSARAVLLVALLQVQPGVVGEDADNAGGHNGRGHAKDADKWLNLGDLANNFGLKLLLVGDSF